MPARTSRRAVLGMIGAAVGAVALPVSAVAVLREDPAPSVLDARIREVLARPEFTGARWGMRFARLGAADPLYALDPAQLFVPASAVKVFIGATVLEELGPDALLRTAVQRTGPVVDGELRGDLVLVAGGDMLIGGRVGADGSLAFTELDHSYDRFPGAAQAPGDPLATLRALAAQVRAVGIRRVTGRVLVDASLFAEGQEDIASGSPITVSPMMVNDNLVDLTVTAGDTAGAPATLVLSPDIGYLSVRNEVLTVADAAAARPLQFADEATNADGTHTLTLTGDVPLGATRFRASYTPAPTLFAATAFARALQDEGVEAVAGSGRPSGDREPVAEHVPLPVSEQVKGMLKISSNIHTVMWPYVVGAVAGHDPATAKATYQGYLRDLYREAGVDPDAPGVAEGRYSSDFFVAFLDHVAGKPWFDPFRQALPILGVDGKRTGIAPDSPAVGHVFAKTGTGVGRFRPEGPPTVYKALAGYVEMPDGDWVTFAQFMEVPVESVPAGQALADKAGTAMGEIAALVHGSAG